MTEFDIQKELFDHFLTLNDVSRIQYIKIDNTKEGYKKYTNVHFPNVPFTFAEASNESTTPINTRTYVGSK